MSVAALHCSILGTIAAFWEKLLATPPNPHPPHTPPTISRRCTHLQHTQTHTHTKPSHPLSSYNPPAKPSLSMQTPHPVGPCQGKLEREVGCFCFEALYEKEKNPNHFLSWSNLTCCDNCSVRNFFDISEREDFF